MKLLSAAPARFFSVAWALELSASRGRQLMENYTNVDAVPLIFEPQDIGFNEWGGHPGSSERWVDLRDDLTTSILQARIIERGLPIRIVVGELS